MPEREVGYTRRQAAEAAGIALRTLDYYKKKGLIKGRIQYVPGRGHMRVFTQRELAKLAQIVAERMARQPEGLRRYRQPPPEDAQ